MSGGVKVPGVVMTFEGGDYVVPPLNFVGVKQHREAVSTFLRSGEPQIEVVCTLLHAALLRNYPAVTLDQVESWVDFGNMVPIMDTVMHTSGLALAMGNLSRRIQAAMDPTAPASTS